MVWALVYAPSSIHEKSITRSWSFRRKYKGRGKYEAQNEKYGAATMPGGNAPISLFCAIAIFEMQRNRLLNETRGLDEVLKVVWKNSIHVCLPTWTNSCFRYSLIFSLLRRNHRLSFRTSLPFSWLTDLFSSPTSACAAAEWCNWEDWS